MDRDRDPRLHPLTRVGLYLLLFVVLQVVVGIPAIMIWAVTTGTSPTTFAEGTIPVAAVLFVSVCLAPVMVPATIVFLRKLDRRPLASIGARLPEGGVSGALRQAAAGAAGAAGLIALWTVLAALPAELGATGVAEGFGAGPSSLPGGVRVVGALLLFCVGFLIQGGLEEWVFRGYVYGALRERWGWATAAGASALGFAVLHLGNPAADVAGMVNTFLLGVALAALVEGTGTLWLAAAAHGVWNFLLATVLGLPLSGARVDGWLALSVDGPAWVTGGEYGPEGSWLLTGLLVPVVGGLALWADARGQGQGEEAAASSGPER